MTELPTPGKKWQRVQPRDLGALSTRNLCLLADFLGWKILFNLSFIGEVLISKKIRLPEV
jgi:hypothetical protein